MVRFSILITAASWIDSWLLTAQFLQQKKNQGWFLRRVDKFFFFLIYVPHLRDKRIDLMIENTI